MPFSDWYAVGGALHSIGSNPGLFDVWDSFSQLCASKYPGRDKLLKRWGQFNGAHSLGTLVYMAREDNPEATLSILQEHRSELLGQLGFGGAGCSESAPLTPPNPAVGADVAALERRALRTALGDTASEPVIAAGAATWNGAWRAPAGRRCVHGTKHFAETTFGDAGAAEQLKPRLLEEALYDVSRPFIASARRGKGCFFVYAQASEQAAKGGEYALKTTDRMKKVVILRRIWQHLSDTGDNNGKGVPWAELLKHILLLEQEILSDVQALDGKTLSPLDRGRGLTHVFANIEGSCFTTIKEKIASGKTYSPAGYYKAYGLCYEPGSPHRVVRMQPTNFHVHLCEEAMVSGWEPPGMDFKTIKGDAQPRKRKQALRCCRVECGKVYENAPPNQKLCVCSWRRCINLKCAQTGVPVDPKKTGEKTTVCPCCKETTMKGTLEVDGGGADSSPAPKQPRTDGEHAQPMMPGGAGPVALGPQETVAAGCDAAAADKDAAEEE